MDIIDPGGHAGTVGPGDLFWSVLVKRKPLDGLWVMGGYGAVPASILACLQFQSS